MEKHLITCTSSVPLVIIWSSIQPKLYITAKSVQNNVYQSINSSGKKTDFWGWKICCVKVKLGPQVYCNNFLFQKSLHLFIKKFNYYKHSKKYSLNMILTWIGNDRSTHLDRKVLVCQGYLRLAGRYRRLPLDTCKAPASPRNLETRPSPTTESCASETSLTESS